MKYILMAGGGVPLVECLPGGQGAFGLSLKCGGGHLYQNSGSADRRFKVQGHPQIRCEFQTGLKI